jgi:zinc transporter ZupT
VACGIVVHDIGDGMNTVLLSTAGEKPEHWDRAFLVADAIAPFLGGLLTIWWVQSASSATILLAVASGFFLQMATGGLLPGSCAYATSRWYLLPLILFGVSLIYAANILIHAY